MDQTPTIINGPIFHLCGIIKPGQIPHNSSLFEQAIYFGTAFTV